LYFWYVIDKIVVVREKEYFYHFLSFLFALFVSGKKTLGVGFGVGFGVGSCILICSHEHLQISMEEVGASWLSEEALRVLLK